MTATTTLPITNTYFTYIHTYTSLLTILRSPVSLPLHPPSSIVSLYAFQCFLSLSFTYLSDKFSIRPARRPKVYSKPFSSRSISWRCGDTHRQPSACMYVSMYVCIYVCINACMYGRCVIRAMSTSRNFAMTSSDACNRASRIFKTST